ncbi:hypothetical protein M3221_13465 [Domibacillus indicus]|uniref:hypothetical protein n=1 Tax=Domibacillus indicus TaxID=1437523 RepID=UPI00203E4B15|nr:hypothetical protein [Domibacillus indicus]MCM3789409.1 hypothetical protein [Domibacillus indicus]
MSQYKTDQLQLHKWGLDDDLDMYEWNENFRVIESLVGPCKMVRSGKDANGVFTTVEYRNRVDDKLVVKVVLSGGTSPQYTTRTFTVYEADGTTVKTTVARPITYDADGDWTGA